MRSGNTAAFELLRAMRGFLGDNDMMAYLAMMAVRLLELHRVLGQLAVALRLRAGVDNSRFMRRFRNTIEVPAFAGAQGALGRLSGDVGVMVGPAGFSTAPTKTAHFCGFLAV
ncbi:hypothetical protein ACQKO5_14765 [Novosphingobium subterraneum]|uniref:hypothetical protein n=1 Tax=Novosphingobium subterraneum TaxID=48936 RepID=UPI003D074C8F